MISWETDGKMRMHSTTPLGEFNPGMMYCWELVN